MAFAEYLGIHPRFTDSTMTGGSSFEVHLEHAAAAIATGLCDVVVDVYAATPRSDRHRQSNRPRPQMPEPNPALEWEVPFGLRQPMGPYAPLPTGLPSPILVRSVLSLPPSSRGPGHRPLTAATGVRIPLGVLPSGYATPRNFAAIARG